MSVRWDEALAATKAVSTGSDYLDRQIFAAGQGETWPAPHYTHHYFEKASGEGQPVQATTNPEHAIALLDDLAPGCNVALTRTAGGWSAEVTHSELNIRRWSGAARETMALAIVVAAIEMKEPYHIAEMAKLDRSIAREEALTNGPPAADSNPRIELERLGTYFKAIGREGLIDFEGKDGEQDITTRLSGVGPEVASDVASRLKILAPALITCEIPEWDQGKGSSGTLRIIGPEDVWLSGTDFNEDWALDRQVDLDMLADAPEDDSPSF
ncbi:MAG: hypothetical protein ABJN42_19900 [Roseibium sp.]|uniref:hypothetical protein n=1 Tax=Roseibium sp. TaxID=1936156 RepID=UPI00329A0428